MTKPYGGAWKPKENIYKAKDGKNFKAKRAEKALQKQSQNIGGKTVRTRKISRENRKAVCPFSRKENDKNGW